MNARSVIASLGASAALAAGTFGFAIPALAAPVTTQAHYCAGGQTCTYYNGGYSGLMYARSPGSAGLSNLAQSGYNDALSSWGNNSGVGARFYYDINYGGKCVSMYAQSQASASATNPDNDKASSLYWSGSC